MFMLNKIDFSSAYWDMLGASEIPKLIKDFSKNCDVKSETFLRLSVDEIWNDGECFPAFFIAVPYLVEMAAESKFEVAREIWSQLGYCIPYQDANRSEIPNEVLICFDEALKYGESQLIEALIQNKSEILSDAYNLIPALFSFANHRAGKLTSSNYFLDPTCGDATVSCNNDHINEVFIFAKGLSLSDKPFKNSKMIPCVSNEDFQMNLDIQNLNPWKLFGSQMEEVLKSSDISEEIRTHLLLAKKIVESGITASLPMRFAFSLCGSLFYWCGDVELALRAYHGWDTITCPVCGQSFRFADYWNVEHIQ